MWENWFAVHLQKAEVPSCQRTGCMISASIRTRQTPNLHSRLTLAEAIAAFCVAKTKRALQNLQR